MIRNPYSLLTELRSLSISAPTENWSLSAPKKTAVSNGYSLAVLRLDKVFYDDVRELSGNKVFKLLPNVADMLFSDERTVLSFGGRWSNHLWSLSAAARHFDLESVGIVRGERPVEFTPTLKDAQRNGMHLHMLPRRHFSELQWLSSTAEKPLAQSFSRRFQTLYENARIIPAGGCDAWGVLGAYILGCSLADRFSDYRWVCAAGSGTMAAGLSLARAEFAARGYKQISNVVAVSVADSAAVQSARMSSVFAALQKLLSERDGLVPALDAINRTIQVADGFGYLELRNVEPKFASMALHSQDLGGYAEPFYKQLRSPDLESYEDAIEPVYMLPLLQHLQIRIEVEPERNVPILVIHGGGLQGARKAMA